MNRTLPTPTVELVKARCDEFDHEPSIQLPEGAVRLLWTAFPLNDVEAHVLLKVLVLNKLYNTQIYDIDIGPLARHIYGSRIDPLLDRGSPMAIDIICNCPPRRNFSFATKYCNWHNPTKYPIYDHNVDECLWHYQKQDGFAMQSFQRQNLRQYAIFYDTMIAFQNHYKLDSFTFKEIDKFLWLEGYASMDTDTSEVESI